MDNYNKKIEQIISLVKENNPNNIKRITSMLLGLKLEIENLENMIKKSV